MLNPGTKSVQNGPQMAPKCPRQGPFGSDFGSVLERRYQKLINVYYNVQAEAFVATFVCYIACIKAVIGMLGLLGTSGALLGGLLVASEPLLEPFGAYLSR